MFDTFGIPVTRLDSTGGFRTNRQPTAQFPVQKYDVRPAGLVKPFHGISQTPGFDQPPLRPRTPPPQPSRENIPFRDSRDWSKEMVRSSRVPLEQPISASELYEKPAGQYSRNIQAKKANITRDASPLGDRLSRRGDTVSPHPAGKSTQPGKLITSSLDDHLGDVIKEAGYIEPHLKEDTTYNHDMAKRGFGPKHGIDPPKEPTVKLERPSRTPPPPKRYPNEVKKLPAHDQSETVLTMAIPDDLEPAELKRELAKKGFQVVRGQFETNTITHQRNGRGFVEVRAPDPRTHEQLRHELKQIGLKYKRLAPGESTQNNLHRLK